MAKTKRKERVFSAHEVANICGVVNQTAINWIDKGHLDAFRTPGGQYRVYPDVLGKFLQRQGIRLPKELQEILAEQARIESVLIIDDDQTSNDDLRAYLAKRYPDFSINQSFDGFDAGRAIPMYAPDLVFLNIELPGVNGLKLCGSIKSDENLNRPMVIAVTSSTDATQDDAATEAGADTLLRKPLDLDTLPELIERLAEDRATRRD